MSLTSLCSRSAYFLESNSTPRALKKLRGRGSQSAETSELTPAQTLRSSFSPPREADHVFFSRADQPPSAAASNMVSFGGSENEILDDSVSLAASEGEELLGSIYDPALPQSGESSKPKPGTDANLFHVLSRALDELGLEWSLPEEPTHSRLDKWFLPRCRQPPRQRFLPFFLKVHKELTRS